MHTPGPWHRNIRAGGKYPTVFANRNTHVAVVTQQKDADETEANISLIAAAPELADALRRLLEVKPNHNMHHGKPCEQTDCRIALARAALAKVDGK